MSYEFTGGYKIREQGAPHFLTFTIEGWVDVFTRLEYKDILMNSLKYCRDSKGFLIHAYVVMSNHMHTIRTARNNNLSNLVKEFKTFTSRSILQKISTAPESRNWMEPLFRKFAGNDESGLKHKLWRTDFHPEIIYTKAFFDEKIRYIHENPVRAGWVRKEEDYLYGSARNYAGGKGLIDIDYLY